MATARPYRKFKPQQARIEELEKINPRFRRVYSEYELMTDQLYDLENSTVDSIPDVFIEVVQLQTEFLEDEIGDWLQNAKIE